MKILHLTYALEMGGAESMLVDILNRQVHNNDVYLIVINNKYNELLINNIDPKVHVIFINRCEGGRNPLPILRLNKLCYDLNPWVIHCHNHSIVSILLSYFYDRSLLTIHGLGIRSKYLKKYKRLIAISNSVRKDLLDRYNIYAKLIYNGIIIENIKQKNIYSVNDSFKIVIVSRLNHKKKGQHIVIEAIKTLKDQGISNVNLDIIGSGESEEYIKHLICRYELENEVNLLGARDRKYIYEHLKDYDLLIQPSLREGFGLTVAEGIAACLPVLVSDCDGPKEILEQIGYGFKFRKGDIEDCAAKILKIYNLTKNNHIHNDTRKALNRLKNNFSLDITLCKYFNEYKSISRQ
jgi:glycosyltransferase involved in cell wall biosynthesis